MIPWQVTTVTALPDFSLALTFADGTSGIATFDPIKDFRGFMTPVRDATVFAGAYVSHHTVCWGADLDFSPERLYERVKNS